jgi:predicted metal-dependent hydrolase
MAPPSPRRVERESIAFALDDQNEVLIERVRDPRARRLKLSVSERGVRLTLPLRARALDAERFLAAQRDWLQIQLARYAAEPVAALVPFESAALPLRGAHVPLHWQPARFARIQRIGDRVEVQWPMHAKPRVLARLLREFYTIEARADVGAWLPRHLPTLPRAPTAFRYAPLSSLWGSLSPAGGVSLDLALVLGPPAAFEYVLVHELCHLLQANHSPAFWAEVEQRCPDWRQQRAYLRGEGMQLKVALRGLLATDTPLPVT